VAVTQDAEARPPGRGPVIPRGVKAHSARIRLLRWLLPASILGILGLLGVFVGIDAFHSAAARPKETPTRIRMLNPHFLGRDDQGRAFNLAAQQATRDDSNMQQVFLDAPVMAMNVDGDHPSTLTADKGVYREDTRILLLTGHVRMDDSKASTVVTNQAVVDTLKGTVDGHDPISARGATGAIQAGSYSAADKGDKLILRGGVHAVLKAR
jgi:lipopolysaccharide export system protein LptC